MCVRGGGTGGGGLSFLAVPSQSFLLLSILSSSFPTLTLLFVFFRCFSFAVVYDVCALSMINLTAFVVVVVVVVFFSFRFFALSSSFFPCSFIPKFLQFC